MRAAKVSSPEPHAKKGLLLEICFLFFIESAARRPKLKLLPRTVKDPVNDVVHTARNESIFGKGRPRDEREFEDNGTSDQDRRTISESSH